MNYRAHVHRNKETRHPVQHCGSLMWKMEVYVKVVTNLPVIVAAVLKVNEHQFLFVWALAALQQQDVSWKQHTQVIFYEGDQTCSIQGPLTSLCFTFLTIVVAEHYRRVGGLQQRPEHTQKKVRSQRMINQYGASSSTMLPKHIIMKTQIVWLLLSVSLHYWTY